MDDRLQSEYANGGDMRALISQWFIFSPNEKDRAVVELGEERELVNLAGQRCRVTGEYGEIGFVSVSFPQHQVEGYPARPSELLPIAEGTT